MSKEFYELADQLEDAGYKTGARRTRKFVEALRASGDAPSVILATKDLYPPTSRQFALFSEPLTPYERSLEAELAKLRYEYESYDPANDDGSKPQRGLSSRFAYEVRQRVGGNAPDDMALFPILDISFDDKPAQRSLSGLIGKLYANDNIVSVGELRNASTTELHSGRSLKTVAFLQVAFKRFERPS